MCFGNTYDLELFLLAYTDRFKLKYFGSNITKAWQDARKN